MSSDDQDNHCSKKTRTTRSTSALAKSSDTESSSTSVRKTKGRTKDKLPEKSMATLQDIEALMDRKLKDFAKSQGAEIKEMFSQIVEMNNKTNERLNMLEVKLEAFATEIQTTNTNVREIEAGVNYHEKEIAELRNTSDHIIEDRIRITQLEFIAAELKTQQDEIDAYNRRAFVLLKNLPGDSSSETSNDILGKAQGLLKAAKIDIEASDIDVIHRMGNNIKKDNPRPVIIKFLKHSNRATIISKRFDISAASAKHDYHGNFPPPEGGRSSHSLVYEDEFLTRRRQTVVRAALELRKRKIGGIKSVSSYNGVPQICFLSAEKQKVKCISMDKLIKIIPEAKEALP